MIGDIFGFIAIIATAFIFGKIISKIKLPAILGWLIVGIVFGPYLGGLVSIDLLNNNYYKIFIHVFEAFAGVMIGSEINFKKLKKSGGQIIVTTLFQSLGTFTVKDCLFDNVWWNDTVATTADGIRCAGLNDADFINNTFNNIGFNAIGINGGGSILGEVSITNNDFSNISSRAVRLHSANKKFLGTNGSLLLQDNTYNKVGLGSEENKNEFIKASTTDSVPPYQFEEGNDPQFKMLDNDFTLIDGTKLTLEQLNDGTMNAGSHSGSGSVTYLNGLYINA
jgi:hypothetical protein